MTITSPAEEFRVGRVIGRTAELLGRNAVMFTIVSVLTMIPYLAINLYLGTSNYFVTNTVRTDLITALSQAIQFSCPWLLQAMLIVATIAAVAGKRPSIGKVLHGGSALFLPLVGLTIVTWIGITLGTAVFVVPGMMLATAWSIAVPVHAAEHTGFKESLVRSAALTWGHRWKIFALLAIYFVTVALVTILASMLAGGSLLDDSPKESVLYIFVDCISTAIASVIQAVGMTVIYHELRALKEGATRDQLAAVFD